MARRINFTGRSEPFNPSLHNLREHEFRLKFAGVPTISRSSADIETVLSDPGEVGLDLEFDPQSGKASIFGVCSLDHIVSIPYDNDRAVQFVKDVKKRGKKLVGHAVIGADRPIMAHNGAPTDLTDWRDTMLYHYLNSQDLCKSASKKEDNDGGLGFMGLWTMASMYTDVWMWKDCPGDKCTGAICPMHDPFGYCGVDSWTGLKAYTELVPRLEKWGVPEKFINELHELSDLCSRMQTQGIRVDPRRINELNTFIANKKSTLFKREMLPSEGYLFDMGQEGDYIEFNPNSPKQIITYFKDRGLDLKDVSKETVSKTLKKRAEKLGYRETEDQNLIQVIESTDDELDEVTDTLVRLYQYKDAGKGVDSWYDDKYIDHRFFDAMQSTFGFSSSDRLFDGSIRDVEVDYFLEKNGNVTLIHPRFPVTGTSTGRLSSSKPNFQNIAVRGFGKLVKSCIVPLDNSMQLIDTDLSQLELRMVLYLSGVDPSIIGKDAFQWLVEASNGKFDEAAKQRGMSARDLAKQSGHAGSYGEGLKLYSLAELSSPRNKEEIAAGALRPYYKRINPNAPFDWEYMGKIVCNTGVNMAERLFGNKSLASRKQALEIQEDVVYKTFPSIRVWQKTVSEYIESHGSIKSPTGRYIRLYGYDAMENLRQALSFLGQGVSADHVQGIMLVYSRAGILPLIQVHDSLVNQVPRDWSAKKIHDFMSPMFSTTDRLTNFSCPGKIKAGLNYGEFDALTNPLGMKPVIL